MLRQAFSAQDMCVYDICVCMLYVCVCAILVRNEHSLNISEETS